MALIKCSNCGKKVSDKADYCVHCGSAIKNEIVLKCDECGAKISETDTVCSKCGCPVKEKEDSGLQKVQVVRIGSRVSKTKLIVGISLVAVLIATAIIIISISKSHSAAVYKDDLETISYKMLNGAASAEKCGNTIKSVWYNTIWKKDDSETDKYTKKFGVFNTDFNDSLSALFKSYEFSLLRSEVEDNQGEVSKLMKNMKNPPSEWKDAYDDLKEYYDNYLTLTNLCTNPTGSLQTFSSNFSQADNDTVNNYDKMKTYFD